METEVTIEVEGTANTVSGLRVRPEEEWALYIVAHGAGAGMRHPFMDAMALGLAAHGVGTLRYQFPYMEEGKRYPNPPRLLEATVRSAVRYALQEDPTVPLLAGGKSMGGRMTSRSVSYGDLSAVRGLVFLGFPLHAPGKHGVDRADHLALVEQPMLFLQGTRDAFARRDLIESVVGGLGGRGTLHFVEGGDHSFNVLKRSGRGPAEVREELLGAITDWAARDLGIPGPK